MTSLARYLNKERINSLVFQSANSVVIALVGRTLDIIHIPEYPKCGASWLRRMLETYFDVEPYHYNRFITKKSIVQMHALYSCRHCNPIVMYRDPRDVFVSFYFYEKKKITDGYQHRIGDYMDFNSSSNDVEKFREYLKLKLSVVTDPSFSYSDFHESWFPIKKKCIVKYEEFHANPINEFSKILNFLNLEVDITRIENAVAYNSFNAVVKRKYGENRNAGVEDKSKFQRKGVVGDWKNYYDEESLKILYKHTAVIFDDLGYS